MRVNFTVNFLYKERIYFKMTNLPKMKIGIVVPSFRLPHPHKPASEF